ncbi:hypothetical protein MMC25_001607 [Agyrium rufum]|nr:hypothetical protein [Agyrium rufum]
MPPRLPRPSLGCAGNAPRPIQSTECCRCLRASPSSLFSTTRQRPTRRRQEMWEWLSGPGRVFKEPLPGSTNYLSAYDPKGRLRRLQGNESDNKDKPRDQNDDVHGEDSIEASRDLNLAGDQPIPPEKNEDLNPFPMNRHFRSQAVLSEQLKEEIWRRIVLENQSVRYVSSELGVEMKRVGAVIRLKTIEKEWVEQGKSLATPYARAVLKMLPQTDLSSKAPHEPINDLPVHRATQTQIFHPVSESRHFTRADAARVFDPELLPADERIPHPELIIDAKESTNGETRQVRDARKLERMRQDLEQRAQAEARRAAKAESGLKRVDAGEGSRWEWRFREISVEDVGPKGRGERGVGARYGVPPQDRRRGQIKIPTRVE